MGCNCGKNKKKQTMPAGFKGGAKQAPKPQGTQSAPAQGRSQSFELRTPQGSTAFYGSKLEAQAARLRAGGGTIYPVR